MNLRTETPKICLAFLFSYLKDLSRNLLLEKNFSDLAIFNLEVFIKIKT